RAEEEDGRIYKALLALVETAAPGTQTTLPLSQVESRWRWWTSRPRTDAWAERYGGGFDLVEKLLRDSQAALEAERDASSKAERIRVRRYRVVEGAAAVFGVLLLVAAGAPHYAWSAKTQAQPAAADAERSFSVALKSTAGLVSTVQENLDT